MKGEAKVVMASCNPKQEAECYEILFSPPMPYADFENLLKAKKVKINFGETVFELTAEEVDGLKDLQRALGQ